MPKAFTENEKKIIRERLLEQGYKLFSTYGLKKTSIEELAQAAGISKAAFYIFFESKEALFMDIVEQTEQRMRQEVLALVDQPGPSPRARLVAMIKKAFAFFLTTPILQIITSSDFDQLQRRVPAEKIQEHLASDLIFVNDLLNRCREAGIPIQARVEEISGLFYMLLFAILHVDDLGQGTLAPSLDILFELVAAFCLGEIPLPQQNPAAFLSGTNQELNQ